MKLAYFPNYCALNSHEAMSAFLQSCNQHNIETVENSMTADAAIIWSVTWAGRLSRNQQIYQHYRQTGRPVIVLEVGALHRGRTWKIAVNNITADGYYGHHAGLDSDRPAKLKISIDSNKIKKPGVLLVLQNHRSLQVADIESMEQWLLHKIQQIKQYTDRPIIVRPHPRSKININQVCKNVLIQTPSKLPNTYDNFDIDYHHHAVINYNSGAGIQAALAGSNVVVDQSSLAYPVSTQMHTIEQSITVDRHQWLIEIAHTEYLTSEIEQGLWLPRLAPMLPL